MTTKKIRYLLEQKGRYYYQRKVPKALTHALKKDRWHLPVGGNFETATDSIKNLKRQHDALIAKAKADPNCSIPDDHISPRRFALFMARSVLRNIREGVQPC